MTEVTRFHSITDWRMFLQEQKAYVEGWDACESGIKRDLNPYHRSSTEWMAWWLGWDECWADIASGRIGM